MSRFANICFLVKQLQIALISNRNIWDSIAIVIAFDLLYNNFETTTTNMLKSRDKTINKIW